MITLPATITSFMDQFRKNGFQIYAVGGVVRDLVMGKVPPTDGNDWDFTTNATPQEILNLFPQKAFYHNTYGTVTVPSDNNLLFEVTPFRAESAYDDSRHPSKIEWAATLEEDLSRRDFTVNAIAFDGTKIIDLFDGQKDIERKLIRTVGDPNKRFGEDALRLMRAVRFSSQLGFLLEDQTRDAIRNNAATITKISGERIRDELLKILASEHPAEGILFLRSTGLLEFILPELDVCFTVPQKSPKRHHIYDVGTHLVMSLKHTPATDPITRLAVLLHDVGKAKTFRKDEETGLITFYNHEVVGKHMMDKIADRLKLSNKQKEKLVRLVEHHQFTVSEIQTDKAVRRFIRNVGHEYLQDMLDLRTGDRIGGGATPTSWRLDLFKKRIAEVQKEPFKVTDLKINGQDVMNALGIPPGPQIGKILNDIFAKVENGDLKNDRESLLAAIRV
ncbi:CCA tRNA nucleotidyltransferase [Candidatus Microgenomates bacterium]|nr:CCA tRNA nucleotidyltransferase [Candidatus Microgenomates bacterium]